MVIVYFRNGFCSHTHYVARSVGCSDLASPALMSSGYQVPLPWGKQSGHEGDGSPQSSSDGKHARLCTNTRLYVIVLCLIQISIGTTFPGILHNFFNPENHARNLHAFKTSNHGTWIELQGKRKLESNYSTLARPKPTIDTVRIQLSPFPVPTPYSLIPIWILPCYNVGLPSVLFSKRFFHIILYRNRPASSEPHRFHLSILGDL